jgi:hypothetical protein
MGNLGGWRGGALGNRWGLTRAEWGRSQGWGKCNRGWLCKLSAPLIRPFAFSKAPLLPQGEKGGWGSAQTNLRRCQRSPILALRERGWGELRYQRWCAELRHQRRYVRKRPPHPPLRGTFSHQGEGKPGAALVRKTRGLFGEPTSPLEGEELGVSSASTMVRGEAQSPPHPTRLCRPTFSHQGRRGTGAALARKS